MARRSGDVSDLYSFRAAPSPPRDPEGSGSTKNPFLNFNLRENQNPQAAPQGSTFAAGRTTAKYDPAGTEGVPGERQWRVKANTEHSKKHSKIVGVTLESIKLYDEFGSILLRDFPLKEIAGFNTDIGVGVFTFVWKPTAAHSGEKVLLFTKKYCVEIQQSVNHSLTELLRARNVDNAHLVVSNAGLNQVFVTTPTAAVGDVVRRLSSVHKKELYPPGGYVVPDSPVRRDSNAPPPPTTAQKSHSRKGSNAIPVAESKKASTGFVDLDD
jgi:hypothetical protein